MNGLGSVGHIALTRPNMVGVTGFEPATSSSRTKRATKLRYIPIRCKSNFTRIADPGSGCEIRLPAVPSACTAAVGSGGGVSAGRKALGQYRQ